MPRDTKVLRCVSRKSLLLCSRSLLWLLPPSFIQIMTLQRSSALTGPICLSWGFAAQHFYRNTLKWCPLVLPLWLRCQMTFRWWTLDEGSLKCTAGRCNRLQMEVRLRRLCRSHLSRFKQNRSEALCFFFAQLPVRIMQSSKTTCKWANIREHPWAWLRETDPFTSFSKFDPPRKLPFGSYLFRKAFITVLLHFLMWKLYFISSQKSFSLSTPSVWPRLHCSYFSLEFCLFSTSVSLFTLLKILHATKVHLPVWQHRWKVRDRRTSHDSHP